MVNERITKKTARDLFNSGNEVYIGSKCYDGTGAQWKFSQFETNDFDEICKRFARHYCSGKGVIRYPMFYIIKDN